MSTDNDAVVVRPRSSHGVLERRPTDSPPRPWIAGVCSSLAVTFDRRVGLLRAAFVAALLVLGIGLIAYLACWLILPRRDAAGQRDVSPVSGAVAGFVIAVGGGLALVTLAAGSALAVAFGLGWGVLIVAGAVLATGVIWLRSENPGLVLLPVAALVVPAAIVLATHEQLPRRFGSQTVAPTTTSWPAGRLTASTGTVFVDLRRFAFGRGTVGVLKIDGGVGRTVIALPPGRCVGVRLHYDVHAGLLHAAADFVGIAPDRQPLLSIFGQTVPAGVGDLTRDVGHRRPVVTIDYRAQGGALYVRDYPTQLNPLGWADWPGAAYPPAPRPSRGGLSRGEFSSALADWRSGREAQRRVDRLTPGPCRRSS